MKWCKRFFWTVVVLATLWVLLVQVANWRGGNAWAEARERLKDNGEVWTLEELTPKPVPDAENFFGTEALLGINRVESDEASGGAYEEKRERLESMFPLRRVEGFELPKEDETGRRGGRARDYAALLEYVREAGTLQVGVDVVGEGESARVLAEALEATHGELFAELEAAAARKYSVIESNFLGLKDGEMLFNVGVPHYFAMQKVAKTMKLRAGLAAAAGNGERGRSSVAVMLRLAEGARGEPIYISQLVARAIEALAVDAVWEGLEARCFSEGDLVWLQEELGGIDLGKGYLAAMRGELLAGLDAMEVFSRGGEESAGMLSMISAVGDDGASATAGAANFGVSLAPSGWWEQNRATLVNWSLDYQILPVKSGGLGAVVGLGRKLEDELIAAKESVLRWPHTVIPALIMPAMGSIGRMMQLSETVGDECVVACGLERFRLAEGRYPDRLEELVPKYLDAVPEDPHADAAMRYRKGGDGFVLWTVGPDGEDDGADKGEKSERKEDFDGDWCWRQRVAD